MKSFQLVLSFVVAALALPTYGQPHFAEPLGVVEAWLEAQKDYEKIPSISAGVVSDQELIWSRGFGYADIQHQTSATDSTIYSICSISKLFTAIAIMQLRDQGKLNLDDPIEKHLSWFTIKRAFPESGPITIRSLLTHSSGLPRESDFPYWTDRTFPFPEQQQLRKKLPGQETLYPSSSVFQYSNLGMSLLGEVVSALSGMSYEQYIQKRILQPLALRQTRTTMPKEMRHGQLATGYTVVSRDGLRAPLDIFSAKGITPAAGFSSTVRDLALFASWQFRTADVVGDPVLNGNTLREMQRVHWMDNDGSPQQGLGFALGKWNGLRVVGHSGGCPGYLTQLRMLPERKRAVIVMVNGLGVDTYRMVEGIFNILNAWEKEKGSAPSYVNLDDYHGTYYSFWNGEFLVTPWKGRLAVFSLRNPAMAGPSYVMEHVTGDTFRFVREDGFQGDEIRFERGADNRVVRFWRHSGYTERVE